MQTMLLAAGVLLLLVGVAHSVLGEVLIFRHLRKGGLVPALPAPPLRERHVRILWATWHLATLLGWGFAVVLLRLAMPGADGSLRGFLLATVVIAYLGSALLVLVGTRGRHPGWIGLFGVAALAGLSAGFL